MTRLKRLGATFAVLAVASTCSPVTASAQAVRSEIENIIREYLVKHPDEIGDMVKQYLATHPEVLQQAIIAMMNKRGGSDRPSAVAPAAGLDKAAAIKSNADLLFHSDRQVNLGAAEGDVTLVEFFDYNCGYCKRALADTFALLRDDPKLKVVLKEYPILGPGSVEAARVGVALRMQDKGGEKYLQFHRRLLTQHGQVNRESALTAAREVDADMAQLATDEGSDEVAKTLEESRNLARSLGINGTPGYVIGDKIVPGAVGAAALRDAIRRARG
jgi:protein-disulfide isomerase